VATSITKATDCIIIMADQKYTEVILINRSRKATPYGAGYTDDPNMITEDLAQDMYMKAFAYRIECDVGTDEEDIVEFQGQGGLLRSDRLVASPDRGDGGVGVFGRYKIYPVTAKQNTKAHLGRHLLGTKMYSHALGLTKKVSFPETGSTALPQLMKVTGGRHGDDDASLPYGLDFTFGSPIEDETNSFTKSLASFSVVRHDFRIEKGQKIGISVWRVGEIAREGTIGKLNETEETTYFGPPSVPIIQTGVVTGVYGDGEVFSHSINTYEGCSGAVVFLLDKDQPAESVQEEDFGKAIGVHVAGYSPLNLGMTVFKAFHSMTNRR
jgi:hypothetical protein